MGAYDLILMTKTAESITVKFPSSIEAADPIVAVADIIAVYGEPAQSMVLVAAYRVDTTPRGLLRRFTRVLRPRTAALISAFT